MLASGRIWNWSMRRVVLNLSRDSTQIGVFICFYFGVLVAFEFGVCI